jgi:starvation-inducible DNA-binding protein
MHTSPSPLPEEARARIAGTLNARLADGTDLYTQIKVAHWNVKGPHFAALHPLFDTFAQAALADNDTLAERAVTLGAKAYGTARAAAKSSRLPDYPADATQGVDHVRLLAERFDAWLTGLRESRGVAEKHGDADTVDVLTEMITEWEKRAWFLRATLEG